MRVAFFDTHKFEREAFNKALVEFRSIEINYLEPRLTEQTVELAKGCDAVCAFVNDCLTSKTLLKLKELGIKTIALRSAGFNHVDINAARELGFSVMRVPEYSPYAVAEHAVALLMSLNRKLHRALPRVRELNFSLEGLVGFDLHGKAVGVIGVGRIGAAFARIMNGFGCKILAFDQKPNEQLSKEINLKYVHLYELLKDSDIISLHLPLTPETRHILDCAAFSKLKKNVIIVNTGRGALIDTKALIAALKQQTIGGACLDVYEVEEGVFFNDLSESGINDDLLARLLTFPNVIMTSHQAFLTCEALHNIAEQTLKNLDASSRGQIINSVL